MFISYLKMEICRSRWLSLLLFLPIGGAVWPETSGAAVLTQRILAGPVF